MLIAFEVNRRVILLWCNKGYDNMSVSLATNFEKLLKIAEEKNSTTFLRFHNHPNQDPSHYNCTAASQQDYTSAEYLSTQSAQHLMNWFDFVCERGAYYRFFSNITDSFFPIVDYISALSKENGVSKSHNYHLHMENRKL